MRVVLGFRLSAAQRGSTRSPTLPGAALREEIEVRARADIPKGSRHATHELAARNGVLVFHDSSGIEPTWHSTRG